MWYAKTLNLDEIADRIKEKDFPNISKKLMLYKVVEHVRFHNIGIRKIMEIEQKLHMSSSKLLGEKNKKN